MNDLFIQLEILRPNGAREDLTVEATRILVGSGAHCDVRLGADAAATEHVLLELRGSALFAIAKHRHPAATSCGKPIVTETQLADGDDVTVGSTRIRARVATAVARVAKRKTRKLLSAVGMTVAMVALPGAVYAALREPDARPIGPPPSEVTPLFDKPVSACPVTTPDQALVLATKKRASARVLREQHPFASTDGLASVVAFEIAGACFTVAARPADAADCVRSSEALRTEMSNEYLVHRVRIEHALDVGDTPTAIREVKILKRLTTGKRGAYIDWLGIVERHVQPPAKE
jgi:hypothetical protein